MEETPATGNKEAREGLMSKCCWKEQKSFVLYSKSPSWPSEYNTKCGGSPVQGASEKVTMLRNRYKHIAESIAFYEAKVARQTAQLDRMHKNFDVDQSQDKGCEDAVDFSEPQYETEPVTDDELRAEEQTIRDLEQKKHALEERVASMEKDLGGLLGLSN